MTFYVQKKSVKMQVYFNLAVDWCMWSLGWRWKHGITYLQWKPIDSKKKPQNYQFLLCPYVVS